MNTLNNSRLPPANLNYHTYSIWLKQIVGYGHQNLFGLNNVEYISYSPGEKDSTVPEYWF